VITKDSPLARPDVSRRLLKPQSLSIINDVCAVIVEERERLELEMFSSLDATDAHLRGIIIAVQRLLMIEQRINAVLIEQNKKLANNEE
jgi:hypothetical protein